jgi:hypothetical protein
MLETLLVIGRGRGIGRRGVRVQGAVAEEMTIGMETMTTKGHMFIVEHLDLVNVMIDYGYGFREGFGKIHVYTDSCI